VTIPGVDDCKGTAWDVVGAAGALSQLAGVIAGFVFAGLIVLLSQPRPHVSKTEQQTGSARLRALIPFFATFVAMGLNAYVFGLLAGEEGGADACRRIWTATAIASGMLAIGTVAAVSGIILLVRAYLAREHLAPSDTQQLASLEKLLTVTIRLLAMVATALLFQRIYELLKVWYSGDLHGLGWVWIFPIVGVCTAIVVAAVRQPAGKSAQFYDRMLFLAGVCTVLYSVAGTALVGFFLGVIPSSDWNSIPAAVPWMVAAVVALAPTVAIAGYLHAVQGIIRITDD
jgi:hypothetical protein